MKRLITDDSRKLRAEAEARFARDPPAAKPKESTAALLHELQVHQIELEIQNEELRRAQVELEKSRDRYVNLYEFAPVGYVTVSTIGIITEVNLSGEPLFGVDRKVLRGSQFAAHVDPDDGDRWHLAFQKALTEKEKQSVAVRIRRADGATVHSWTEIMPVSEEAEPFLRVTLADITEHKRMEEELRALHAQLAVSSRLAALGTLVAGVAHEINNPLAAALSDLELAMNAVQEVRGRLHGSGPLDREAEVHRLDAVVEELQEAEHAGRRIGHIVKDLKTFGRPYRTGVRSRLVDIVNLGMRWLPVSVTREANVSVENGGAPDVVVSPGQIEQVVANLLTNAAQARREGTKGDIVIRLGTGPSRTACLEVIDQGTGIAPAILQRVFDPFFTTRDAGRGTGLGLAICHAIVTAHGGSISLQSEVGKGSTFRVELPAAPSGT